MFILILAGFLFKMKITSVCVYKQWGVVQNPIKGVTEQTRKLCPGAAFQKKF